MDNDHAMTKTGRRKKQRRGVPALWLIESTESTLLSMSEKKVVVRRRRGRRGGNTARGLLWI